MRLLEYRGAKEARSTRKNKKTAIHVQKVERRPRYQLRECFKERKKKKE